MNYSQFEGPIKPNQWYQYIDPFYLTSLLMSSFITITAGPLCNPKSIESNPVTKWTNMKQYSYGKFRKWVSFSLTSLHRDIHTIAETFIGMASNERLPSSELDSKNASR